MKNLCSENGYIDMDYIIGQGYPFTIITGARGTGKTYGAIKHLINTGKKFIYMRRTKIQMDVITTPDMSPFAPVCTDMGVEFAISKVSKETSGVYFGEGENAAGYIMALSGISNVRGFSGEDIEIVIYDEFIPESHERTLKNEGEALFNAYETINRNRELKGKKPLQLVLLSNTNSIVNTVFQTLGLITAAYKMAEDSTQEFKDKDRGLYLINLQNSPISAKKKETALYKLLKDNRIVDMSIYNKYLEKPALQTKTANLKEYKPVVTVGEITIYRHKSERNYYISPHGQGTRPIYGTSENDLLRFRTLYRHLLNFYINRAIFAENPACEIVFCQYFGIVK